MSFGVLLLSCDLGVVSLAGVLAFQTLCALGRSLCHLECDDSSSGLSYTDGTLPNPSFFQDCFHMSLTHLRRIVKICSIYTFLTT